ncbi:MAG: YihY/virulence factor BrkB family protein [Porticoccaceae bacterium]|jgi:membrane protein|nr:YihY/virulence factor BrkB family protein [Porticoccaceae bacterium]
MQGPTGYYRKIKGFVVDDLWRADVRDLGRARRQGYRLARLLFVLVREFANGQLNLRAMSLVYTTLLSMVPLLAVSFSVLKAFGVHNQIEPLLLNLVEPLGEKGNELVMNVLGFVENMKVGVLGSVGLALLLYTVISLVQKIENAFNYVWRAKSSRTLSRRFSDYLSVILVGPVLVFSAIGMTASLMSSSLMQRIMGIEPFGSLLAGIAALLPFALILMAFTFVYMFVPNTRVKFSSALVGAATGGILWQLTGLAFAEFAASSTNYDAIYSGFAILVLFMIWLYLNWLILLLGAQVGYYHQYPEQIRLSSQRAPLAGRVREHLGLLVMYWIAHRFVHDGPPLTLEALGQLLKLPNDRVGETLEWLAAQGLVVESAGEPPEYLLHQDPAGLAVSELLRILRRPDDEQAMMAHRLRSHPAVDGVMARMEKGLDQQLQTLTLRDLVLDDGAAAPVALPR